MISKLSRPLYGNVKRRYMAKLLNPCCAAIWILLSCWLPEALAAPFLYSAPWLAGEAQPTTCSYQEMDDPIVTAPVTATRDGAVFCRFDLATVPHASYSRLVHTLSIWANNPLGASPTVTFSYHAQALAPPSGITIGP
jgi:hypothetical protein